MNFRRMSLLTGYVDGELTPSERQRVETWIARSASVRAMVYQLESIKSALRQLKKAAPAATLLTDVVVGIRKAPGSDAYPQADFWADFCFAPRAVLEVYLDDELSTEQRRWVEAKLATESTWKAEFEMARAIKSGISSLPATNPGPSLSVEQLMNGRSRPKRSREKSVADLLGSLPMERAPESAVQAALNKIGVRAIRAQGRPSPRPSRGGWLVPAVVSLLSLAATFVVLQLFLDTGLRTRVQDGLASLLAPAPLAPVAKDTTRVIHVTSDPGAGAIEDGIQGAEEAMAKLAKPSLQKLAEIEPGEWLELNDKKVRLICVDVERFYDRFRYVLVHHQVPLSEDSDEAAPKPGSVFAVEVEATSGQIRDVLADLFHTEQTSPLVMDVETPPQAVEAKTEAVATIQNPQSSTNKNLIEKLEPVNGPLVRFGSRKAELPGVKSPVAGAPLPKNPAETKSIAADSKALASKDQPDPPSPANLPRLEKSEFIRVTFLLLPGELPKTKKTAG